MQSRMLSPNGIRRRCGQKGIALMLVLWIIALLTIIAVSMTAAQRTETTLAANQVGTVRFRAQAEAAIHYAALNLMARPVTLEVDAKEELWVPDGRPYSWSFGGGILEISVLNEGSLIDLNSAERDLLAGLLSALEIEPEAQDPLLDAILDWRDEDDLHLLNGAEDPDYEAAGWPHGAKDGPFDSIEELRQVLGFERDLYRLLAPVLTVASGKPRIDEQLAPPLVQAALEGRTLEEVQIREAEEELYATLDAQESVLERGGPLYRIRVRRVQAEGAEQAMEAQVLVQQTLEPPVRVLWRRYGLAPEPVPLDPDADLPR